MKKRGRGIAIINDYERSSGSAATTDGALTRRFLLYDVQDVSKLANERKRVVESVAILRSPLPSVSFVRLLTDSEVA